MTDAPRSRIPWHKASESPGEESLASLPKANGVRLSIIEEASIASKKRKEAMIL